ncbi:MAG: hypothetical protein KF784_03560 [Fimbriimonadaceae bacterium]|nr:hypothetical protein [Fimbriimonadaceae bacterium]
MHCGTVIAQPTKQFQPAPGVHTQAMPMPMPAHSGQPKRWAGTAGIIVGVLVVAVMAFALNASGILRQSSQKQDLETLSAQGSHANLSTLQASGSSIDSSALGAEGSSLDGSALRAEGANGSSPLMRADGTPGGPVLPSTDDRKLMPDDIRRWLEHLERIEQKRTDMTRDQLAAAMMQMTELQLGGSMADLQRLLDDTDEGVTTQENIDTAKQAVNTFEGNRRKWNRLNDEFLAVSPPAECVSLRNDYDKVLRETGAMILEIVKSVENAESDRQGALRTLMKLQGTSDSRIGRPARSSDRKLGDICSKYDTAKWFSITSDVGGGMLGKIGF